MAFNIDTGLGIFSDALSIHERRSEILANNLVNQDTPGFKAQDLDFRSMLKSIQDPNRDSVSNNQHEYLEHIKYRESYQASLDGNTVDGQIEQAEFAENTMRYLANLNFLSGRIQGLQLAIKGSK